MSDCKFTFDFNGPSEEILNKAREAVESQNGTFTGDDQTGCFDVTIMGSNIAGSYSVIGQTLELTISNKPFFVPCNMIESFLTKQLQANS